MIKVPQRIKKLLVASLIGGYFCLGRAIWELPTSQFVVSFFDVGQGDAILIETPEHHRILVDGGPGVEVLAELAQALPYFDQKLDMVVLTHPHADHVAGLVEVLKRYEVDSVLFSGVEADSFYYEEFLQETERQEIVVHVAEAAEDFAFGEVLMDVIYPLEAMVLEQMNNLNNASVAVKFMWRGRSVLLTGDLEREAEMELLGAGLDLKADVFKAGHHGSHTSSTYEFVEAVAPDVVVIQAGAGNSFGHPAPETLQTFYQLGVNKIYRTDQDGTVKIVLEEAPDFRTK